MLRDQGPKRSEAASSRDEDGGTPPSSAQSPISVSWDSQANIPTNVSKEIGPGLIVGDYRLEQLIGQGGMGAVYSAHHRTNGSKAAIKILSPELVEDYNAVPRFMLEAKVASKLKSPNAVRVYDYGTLQSGVPYMVMELLEGDTLHAHLRAAPNNQLPAYQAVDYIVQACAAIGEAHEAGIIHRDLKLNNFLLSKQGHRCVLKVLDFGLAKPMRKLEENEPTQVSLTQAGAFFGTPQYMAPEQMIGVRAADPRIDVWALGVCLYAMITGAYPFHGEDTQAICRMVLSNEYMPASELRPDLSPEIEAVIKKCLSPMSVRYPNAGALAEALRRVVPQRRDDEPDPDENWEDEVTRTPHRPGSSAPVATVADAPSGGPVSRTRILASPNLTPPPPAPAPAAGTPPPQQQPPPQKPVLAAPRPSFVNLAPQPMPYPQAQQAPQAPAPPVQDLRARGIAPPPPAPSGPALPPVVAPAAGSGSVSAIPRNRREQRTVLVPRKEQGLKRTLSLVLAVLVVILLVVSGLMYSTGKLNAGSLRHLGL